MPSPCPQTSSQNNRRSQPTTPNPHKSHPSSKVPPRPTRRPSDRPTGRRDDRPTGRPGDWPTVGPSDQPTGKPGDRPPVRHREGRRIRRTPSR
ncbi:PT domain-containing protein [Sphaerisporangium corydalis]|uniref:PT domain-containing protein n=1 Tax=Sphaerisporangium corydalis TaxID=1441875 RepID=A0ABV9EK74_9ACTN